MKNIKRNMTLVTAVAIMIILAVSSCKKTEQKQEAWVMPEHEVVTREMPLLELTDSVKVDDNTYIYEIRREATDSLPKVKDDMDDLYRDNTIRLNITRNGQRMFSRTFTKEDFAASLERSFKENAILDGIRFLHVENGIGLVFAMTVSYPDSDMSVPFLVTITNQGTFSFVKDENLDREEADSVYIIQ